MVRGSCERNIATNKHKYKGTIKTSKNEKNILTDKFTHIVYNREF